jgi:hypothetical protein
MPEPQVSWMAERLARCAAIDAWADYEQAVNDNADAEQRMSALRAALAADDTAAQTTAAYQAHLAAL